MMKNVVEVRGLTRDPQWPAGAPRARPRRSASGVTGLLGPSGCGKSTLLRSIVGVQQVAGGDVRVLGEPAGSAPLRNRIGYVTQAASVYDDLTVTENLRFFARVLGCPDERGGRGGRRRRPGQPRRRARRPAQRRAAVAGQPRGRPAGHPDLLVLDEPTVGLDPVLRRDLWQLFHELADGGAAVLVSSHVMDEAERCDQLLLMRDGAILAQDTPDAIKQQAGADDVESAFLVHRRRPCSMTPRITLAVAGRVLTQVRRDRRTAAMLLVLPCLLIALLWWMFQDSFGDPFNRFGPALLAMFPFIVMFLVTSVTTLRERSSGTLERLLAMPMGKLDFLLGYAAGVRRRRRRPGAARGDGLRSACSGSTSRGRCGCSAWSRWRTPCSARRSGCSSARSRGPSSRPSSSCR